MVIIENLGSQPPHPQAGRQQRPMVQSMAEHWQWQVFPFWISQDSQPEPQEQPVTVIPAWSCETQTSESLYCKETVSPQLFSLGSSWVNLGLGETNSILGIIFKKKVT